MIVFFNAVGAAILFAAILTGTVVERFVPGPPGMPFAIMGVLALGLDLAYRLTRRERSLFRPSKGGNLMFLPVWVLGLAACGLAVKTHLKCPATIGAGLARESAKVKAKLAELEAALDAKADVSVALRAVSPADFDPKPFVDYPNARSNVTFVRLQMPGAEGSGMLFRPDASYAAYRPDYGGGGTCKGDYGHDATCGGIYDLVNLREDTRFSARSRDCDKTRAQVDQVLAMRYLVVQRAEQPDAFWIIDLPSRRVIGSIHAQPEREALRLALTQHTGGTFDFGPPPQR